VIDAAPAHSRPGKHGLLFQSAKQMGTAYHSLLSIERTLGCHDDLYCLVA